MTKVIWPMCLFLLITACKHSQRSIEKLCNCKIKESSKLTDERTIITRESDDRINIYDKVSGELIFATWYDAYYNSYNEIQHDILIYPSKDVTVRIENKDFSRLSQSYLDEQIVQQTEKKEQLDKELIKAYRYEANLSCSWCGKSFKGNHYSHLGKLSDCYLTNVSESIGKYCSLKCCSESRRR